MGKIIKDFLFGFLVVISITISEFLVTLPIGNLWDTYEFGDISPEIYKSYLNREFLLTAIPVVIIVYVFMKILKTNKKSDVMRRGIIWTGIIASNYIIIGLGNDNFNLIFSTVGIYVLFICSFIGSALYLKFNNLK